MYTRYMFQSIWYICMICSTFSVIYGGYIIICSVKVCRYSWITITCIWYAHSAICNTNNTVCSSNDIIFSQCYETCGGILMIRSCFPGTTLVYTCNIYVNYGFRRLPPIYTCTKYVNVGFRCQSPIFTYKNVGFRCALSIYTCKSTSLMVFVEHRQYTRVQNTLLLDFVVQRP